MPVNGAGVVNGGQLLTEREVASRLLQVKIEEYDGSYDCAICSESVKGTAALRCSQCSCNPFHLLCVAGSSFADTCPQCSGKTVERWRRSCDFVGASAAVRIDMTKDADSTADHHAAVARQEKRGRGRRLDSSAEAAVTSAAAAPADWPSNGIHICRDNERCIDVARLYGVDTKLLVLKNKRKWSGLNRVARLKPVIHTHTHARPSQPHCAPPPPPIIHTHTLALSGGNGKNCKSIIHTIPRGAGAEWADERRCVCCVCFPSEAGAAGGKGGGGGSQTPPRSRPLLRVLPAAAK